MNISGGSTAAADLLDALNARRGIVCLTGAGGKKTTMYALAAAHPGRVALSSTSHMYRYVRSQVDCVVSVTGSRVPDDYTGRVVAFAGATDTADRVGGLEAAQIEAIWATGTFDLVAIKADGARARWIKAPEDYEPVVPTLATTVIPVVSARVIGRSLSSGIAHRPERLAAVMGIAADAPIEPRHIARLLSSEHGALKGVGSATVVALINMVDDEALRVPARAAAQAALEAAPRIARVVLASMKEARLVEVVERRGGPG